MRIIGVAVFGAGAVGDLIWHEVFGIEADIEALLSPTHLVLLIGGLLRASGPIASTLRRKGVNQRATWSSTGAIVASVAFMLSALQFFLMYVALITNYGVLLGVAIDQRITWAVHLWTGLPLLAASLVGVISVVVQLPGRFPTPDN